MNTAKTPIITEQGLQAILNATNDGLEAKISHVALGDQGYSIAVNSDGRATQTSLRQEQQRVPVMDGRRVTPQQIDISFVAEGDSRYWVRELGFYLEDGTLFALWSDPSRALAWKSDTTPLIVSLELVLSSLPANSVTVQSGATPLQLIMTREIAAIAISLANIQLEQLRQADRIKTLSGTY